MLLGNLDRVTDSNRMELKKLLHSLVDLMGKPGQRAIREDFIKHEFVDRESNKLAVKEFQDALRQKVSHEVNQLHF